MNGEGTFSNDVIALATGHALASIKEALKAQGKDPLSDTLIVGMEDDLFQVTVGLNEVGHFNVLNVQSYGR